MHHAEQLSKIDEYLMDRLGASERSELERHLEHCGDCRAVLARWAPAVPPRGFEERVMADLVIRRPDTVRARFGWAGILPAWGTAAALVLIGLAFWRPEQTWVRADKTFTAGSARIGGMP